MVSLNSTQYYVFGEIQNPYTCSIMFDNFHKASSILLLLVFHNLTNFELESSVSEINENESQYFIIVTCIVVVLFMSANI